MNVGEDDAINLRLDVSTFMPSKPSKPAESILLSTYTLATESFGADSDDVSHVGLLLVETFRGRFELCVVVQTNVATFLFDVTTELPP